jgi:hypothetical protein
MVAVYAVLLAVTALGGNAAGMDMMMAQQKASNAWARYQAKVLREYMYDLAAEQLDIELADLADEPNANPNKRERRAKAQARYKAEVLRFQQDKTEIKKEAEGYEAERDLAARRDPYFEYGEVLLQISIVLASVSMLSGKRVAFYLSIAITFAGGFLCANGYGLFLKIPGLE